MDSIKINITSKLFLQNILMLKEKMRSPLPSDTILYQCMNCNLDIPVNSDGVIKLQNPLEEHLGATVDKLVRCSIENHTNESEICSSMISIHPNGTPNNILVSCPESDTVHIKQFKLGIDNYKVELLITQENNKAVFAIFQREDSNDAAYLEFIKCNFETFLNIEELAKEDTFEDELVFDDESMNQNQHNLPRITGGGRTLNAKFNYQCLWCPQEVLMLGKKGRFKELRSYRKHFRENHLSENGDGVPMAEFIERVQRSEPTWFCINCKKNLSLGNAVRHKAICKPDQDLSESDSQGTEETITTSFDKSNTPKQRTKVELKNKKKKFVIYSDSSSDEEAAKIINQQGENHSICTNSTLDKEEAQLKASHGKTTKQNQSHQSVDHGNAGFKRNKVYETVSSSDEQNCNTKSAKMKKQRTLDIDYTFLDLEDEIECFELPEKNHHTNITVPKQEPLNEFEIELEVEQNNANFVTYNKWWQKIPLHLYEERDKGGPKIFLPSDTKEFVERSTNRYKQHILEKKHLDEKMLEAESADAKLLQFSDERDRAILNKYTEFVQNSSAKDVLHIFSEEYEQLRLPTGAKSSTASQYSHKILEFFKFMANLYHNFHLDWMLDFKGTIEKTLEDGSKTNDIFLPTKKELTEFIKKYKYGSNPAANCGSRIFAIKKLMDFLKQEIKDHEHAFEGNILEKRRVVDCLVERIKNLSDGICPDGTIKHLATASNKSHKRILLEQMAQCPERNIKSIMKGVQDYIASDEYIDQKTLLIELACKKIKVPTVNEYINSTNWLLEQLICIGGNRPCALLGITLKDWEDRKPGYCPFFQDEENEMVDDDPENDKRKVLKNPFTKPKGSVFREPTGVIVNSETDKITVGQPCYIWFPNALVDLVNVHSLMAEKVLPKAADIYHPKTRLFLNSQGKEITRIECKHFKNYIGLPITAYDFRRSLSTFCLDNKVEAIRSAEPSILRHREQTGYAYYYQKHGERVEYVSIQYAMKHGLIKADEASVDGYCNTLRECANNEEWELSKKRTDKALEYSQEILKKRKQSLNDARQKGGRYWILPHEYDAFIEGIEEAIILEEQKKEAGQKPGPFCNLLNYKPDNKVAGIFPPTEVWQLDMYRVLYGLCGEKGDAMRKAELSVYNGVPFSEGLNGRKKIAKEIEADIGKKQKNPSAIVANYWRDKIKNEARQRFRGKWLPLRFIFTEKELQYNHEMLKSKIKQEN